MGEDFAVKVEKKSEMNDFIGGYAKKIEKTKGQTVQKIILDKKKQLEEEDEETLRTISNMIDRLKQHFMDTLDMSQFKSKDKYHFIIKEPEHFKLLENSGNQFRHNVERAINEAKFQYHLDRIVELRLLQPERIFDGESESQFKERKARPLDLKRTQMECKSRMSGVYNKLFEHIDIKITFVVSEEMLKHQAIHELKVVELETLVQFNCMIMGFVGTIKYNKELDEYVQTVSVMEPEDETVNNNPRIIPCIFHADQTQGLAIGQRKKIIGKYISIPTKEDENIQHLKVDVISVEDLEEKRVHQLSNHDLLVVKEMIKNDVYETFENEDGKIDRKMIMTGEESYLRKLLDSFAPHIDDRDIEKEACYLALIGGAEINEYRAQSHLGLIGNPGCGKSELLKFAVKIAPKGAYVDASNATGKGMLFALDEYEGGKILRAGALVMNNGGMVGLDEFDKMKKEEQKQVNVAMEQQFAKYDKGGHNVIASTKTTVIMACNPNHDVWKDTETIADNLNFGASTISRYDLFILVGNRQGENANRKRVQHILKHSQHKEEMVLDPEYLKGLIAYCRAQPVCMTEEAEKAIEDFYVGFKKVEQKEGALPIEDRQIIGIIRLCSAYARLTFKPKVTEDIVRKVVVFYKKCLASLGMNTDDGVHQVNLLGAHQNRDGFFEETFNKLANDDENGEVNLEELMTELMSHQNHFSTTTSVDKFLLKKKESGFCYNPRTIYWKRMK